MIAEEFVASFKVAVAGGNEAAAQLAKIADKADDAATNLDAVGDAGKDAGKGLGDASKALDATARKLKDVAEQAAKTRERLSGLAKEGGAMAAKLGAGAIGLLGAGAAGVLATTGNIESLHSAASAAGMTTQEYQRLSVVAEKNGATMDRMGMALRALNAKMIQVKADGTDPLSQALGKVGLSAQELAGRSGQERLGILADALGKVQDGSERAALSAMILGEEAGPGLANLLAIGSKGIDETAGAVKVLTDEQIAQAEAVNAKWVDFQGEITAKAREIALALAPVVSDGLARISNWFERHADAIQSAIAGLAKVAGFLVEHFDVLVGLLAGGKLATGMAAVGSAATAMGLSFGAALGPIGAIAGALVALIPIAYSAGEALGDALAESSWADKLYGFTEERASARGLTGDAKIKGDAMRRAEEQLAAFRSASGASDVQAPVSSLVLAASAPAAPGRAGGRGGARRAVPAASEPTSSVTFQDVLSAVVSGRGSDIARNIQGLAANTPKAESIKPTVAITYYHFDVKQDIAGAGNPLAVADASAGAMRKAFDLETARIAQSLAGGIVR